MLCFSLSTEWGVAPCLWECGPPPKIDRSTYSRLFPTLWIRNWRGRSQPSSWCQDAPGYQLYKVSLCTSPGCTILQNLVHISSKITGVDCVGWATLILEPRTWYQKGTGAHPHSSASEEASPLVTSCGKGALHGNISIARYLYISLKVTIAMGGVKS